MMERCSIIGPSGSGKSRLARKLGRVTGLPVIHLDLYFWHPGWTPTPEAEWLEMVQEFVATPAWIIDGNYRPTLSLRLAASDTIILLDYPRRIYLRRLLKRYITANLFQVTRPDVTPGCDEPWWRLPEHLAHGWGWPQRARPDIMHQLATVLTAGQRRERLVHLRSPAETTRYLRQVARDQLRK